MAAIGGSPGESRRAVASPRPNKGRDYNPKSNILCRNVTIYGHCRHEHNGCVFQHDPSKIASAQSENVKKRFNVDSPSFTPLQPAPNGAASSPRATTISPKAANAAVFTPKSNVKSTVITPVHTKEPAPEWHGHEFQEFVPQGFDVQGESAVSAALNPYDNFTPAAMSGMSPANHAAQLNPYTQDAATMGGAAFFQNAVGGFPQPIQYHLYAPMGPHPENLLGYQKTSHDFFIPDHLREDLQRKSEATRQILPNSTLPSAVDHFHSLVPLDTNNQKNSTLFGYHTWVYKAVSGKDGLTYTLRRLEGYRLTSEQAIFSVRPWKRVDSGSIVAIHDAFTTRAFGDSSLIFVTDYHPLSKTLSEQHLQTARGFHGRANPQTVSESVLWSYIVQIASALKAIHSHNLAARLIHPSKILLTSKNRIRLNSCAILDLVHFDTIRPLPELQQEDLSQLGRLVVTIAGNNTVSPVNAPKALDLLARGYSKDLVDCVSWLLSPPANPQNPTATPKDINFFLGSIADKMTAVLDNTFRAEDTLTSNLARELENGRLVRLMAKLNFINERPEFENNPQWSETGERYYIKLFRDYVFHQVDANGHAVVDLGHVISCLNKLDVASDEKISLVSRDEQSVLVVSYREVKRGIEQAFNELIKPKRR
ncbi:PAB-dependent poly(A)-specific ribonuclease subunit PAN3 [Phyllosticta citribraziliensis]|uniref:PAN2-PAN3 deadenylation complex subunit PAN3 n=1 Tax=Phyllosticta citribraziliensis TaxID=989973 RepID=A0ABR1LJK5_9PEZI